MIFSRASVGAGPVSARKELPVALMNKYFEYQTQLCHDAEGAPDTESWERAHSFLII